MPGSSRSTRGGRRAPSGPTCGWAWTWAPTSPWPTRWRARSSTRGWPTRSSSTGRRPAFEAYRARGRAVHARVRGARDGRARGRDPRGGPHLRQGRPRDDLLDTRHHRAPQRGRQRARADLAGAADGARREVRQRHQPAPRPEQRPGRRRHGRAPRSPGGLPARRERRAPRQVRQPVGRPGPAEEGLAPVADVRRDGAGRAHRAVRRRREPDAVRGGPPQDGEAAARPRDADRPGHLPDGDGRDRGRRVPRGRRVGGDAGHRHELRAAGAARAAGARAAGRGARRPADHLRPRQAHGRRLGRARRRDGLERGARSCRPSIAG